MKVKRIAVVSFFCALAIALNIFDTFVSAIFPVGVRIGIANVVIVAALYSLKTREVALITLVKVLLASLILGRLFNVSFFTALFASIFSVCAMYLSRHLGLNILTVSVVGSITHIVTQFIVISFFTSTVQVFYYMPLPLIVSLVSGVVIGLVSKIITNSHILKLD